MTSIPDHLLLRTALDWHRAGRKTAIAMVVETWGSAPRAAGAILVMDADGAMEGSVSGGCVEGAVILEAIEAIADGQPRLLEFGVTDDQAFAVGLACGGRIKVLVEPIGSAMPVALLEQLVTAPPAAYVVDLQDFSRRVASADEFAQRVAQDQSGVEEDGRTFVAVHNLPLRMIVVGAVHIAQPLVQMARACGFAPVLVDPRAAFGSADRFPGEEISDAWPDEALAQIGIDHRTAVVTLTHDPKLDDPALQVALVSPAFYVGALGSRRTHAKRVARLAAAGLDAAQIDRLDAPIGMNLGGRKPAEIAVSIMAQVIATLRKPA